MIYVCGDWRDYRDDILAMQPDACITDPPYGIGYLKTAPAHTRTSKIKGGTAKWQGYVTTPDDEKARRGGRKFQLEGEDGSLDVIGLFELAGKTLMWGADHLRSKLPPGGRFLAWDKLDGREEFGSHQGDVEFAWHSDPGASRIGRFLWKGAICAEPAKDKIRWHPTQKSIRLMEWCIDQCKLEPGSLIVDPYMGSGTTGIAAHRKGMRFVGFDIDPIWHQAALDRMADLHPEVEITTSLAADPVAQGV